MKPMLVAALVLPILILIPISLSHSISASTSGCASSIAQQENQTETIDLQNKAMRFIVNNSPDFKILNQKYHMMWLSTSYNWNTDLSTCTATLNGIIENFELSNSTFHFVGEAHITTDSSVSKVTNVQLDLPTAILPPTCTDSACRVAHGIFN